MKMLFFWLPPSSVDSSLMLTRCPQGSPCSERRDKKSMRGRALWNTLDVGRDLGRPSGPTLHSNQGEKGRKKGERWFVSFNKLRRHRGKMKWQRCFGRQRGLSQPYQSLTSWQKRHENKEGCSSHQLYHGKHRNNSTLAVGDYQTSKYVLVTLHC